jgi:hypothetical protein
MEKEISKTLIVIVWHLIPRGLVEACDVSEELTVSKQQLACSEYSSTLKIEAILTFESSVS